MLVQIRCSKCRLPFSTLPALLAHQAGHGLGTDDDGAQVVARASGPAGDRPATGGYARRRTTRRVQSRGRRRASACRQRQTRRPLRTRV